MKSKNSWLLRISVLFFALISCQEFQPKKEDDQGNEKIPGKSQNQKKIVMASKFSGNFYGINNQKEIFVQLNPVANTNTIEGKLTMNGEQAQITASEKNGTCSGKIMEDNTNDSYAITMKFIGEKLHFSIAFPKHNNQILTLELSKSQETASQAPSNHKDRNPTVVGKWRFTEVLSSGSGEYYASFSTDYFLKINSDGTATTWTGKSAGGTNTVSIEGGYGSNVQHFQWYTNGKMFHFVDPNTQQEEAVNFYAEPSRMLFSYGNNKRLYQRVN